MPSQNVLGIYPSDSVSEVAQSLPLDPLAQGTAEVLAGDVEYRLHLIIQEAKKFMVHGKRATLLPEDVEYAMEALNVEPLLIPPRPLPQQPFVPVTIPAANANANPTQVYHVPDEEIDFATYLKQPLPPGLSNSAGVQWKAHWLAVEGVQPAIPENPTPSSRAGPSRLPIPATGSAALKPSAKSQLPQDLQLYFSRLTSALVPISPPTGVTDAPGLSDMERHRSAAIASLSSDVAVTGLLVYMVKWLSESIQKCLMGPLPVIGYLVDAVEALLQNEHVFLEPYIHQLLGPIMSILLTFPLGPHPPPSSVAKGELTSYGLRVRAAHLLRKVAEVYGPKYPGLLPRLTSTLTKTLNSSPFPSPLGSSYPPAGRYEGAILGLAAVGPHAVRTGIWSNENTPMSRIDDLAVRLYPGSEGKKTKVGLSKAFAKAMAVLCTETTGQSGQTGNGGNVDMDKFGQVFGYNLGRIFDKKDNRWIAAEMLRLKREEESGAGMEVDTPRA